MDEGRVVVAEILRPRGNRGELVARSQTDVPGRLEDLKRANLRLASGSDVAVEIEEAWVHKGDWVLKFAGVDSIDDADRFRGSDLWVPVSERGELPDGEFFQTDLTGCTVIDSLTGNSVGVVSGWAQFGGPPLMEVSAGGKEVLIPFVRAEALVDLAARVIRVAVADGLLDL